MFDRYMKQALALSTEMFADDGRLFLQHHLTIALQQAPVRYSPPGTLALPTASQWLSRRLLNLLKQRDVATVVELLNHLHLPDSGNLVSLLGLFFSFFPEHLSRLSPALRQIIPLNFNWLSLCLTESVMHLSQQIHTVIPVEKVAILEFFKQAEPALNANERQRLIYLLLPLALEEHHSILIRAMTCDLLYRLARPVSQPLQETVIDGLLLVINSAPDPLLYLSVLQTLGAMAVTASTAKKESIIAVLLPFATSHEPIVRKTILAALQALTHKQEQPFTTFMTADAWIESVTALRVALLTSATRPSPETIANLAQTINQTPSMLYLPALNPEMKQEDSLSPSCIFGKK